MIEQIKTPEPAIKLRVPEDFKAEIEAAAARMHISVSAMTRLALADYLKAHAPDTSDAPRSAD